MRAITHMAVLQNFIRANIRMFIPLSTMLFMACMLSGLSAKAQRDIFNWQLSGNGGLVGDRAVLELPDAGSRFASGLRLNRNLGRAWQLGLHASQLDFRNGDQGLTFSGLSFTYNWDNGSLLKQRAFISPFHTIDLGYMARADYREWVIYEESYAYNFENGLKFRLSDHITAQASYAVYWQVDEEDVSSSFDQTFLKVWKVGINYHFGARKVRYKGPTFDASARYKDSDHISVQSISPILELPDLSESRVDTSQLNPMGSHMDMAPKSAQQPDTIFLYRIDTVYAVQRDTVYLDSATFSSLSNAESEERFKALNERMLYLEGFMKGRMASDSVRTYAQDTPRNFGAKSVPDEISVNQGEAMDSQRSGGQSGSVGIRTAQTDPALLEILKRQEEQIANQNLLLRQMQQSSAQTAQTTQPRNRMRTQVSPTVMVPLNNPQDSKSEERIAVLEEQIRQLESRIAVQVSPPPPAVQQQPEARVDTNTSDTVINPLPIATAPSPKNPIVGLTPDEVERSTQKLQLRTDSIDAANAQRQANAANAESQKQNQGTADSSATSGESLRAVYPVVFLFGLNKAEVDGGYSDELDRVAYDLNNDATLKALITGFTDRSGNADYNRQLSKRRADSVREQLLSRGVKPGQVRIAGQGQENASGAWSPSDRRVEVVLE